MGKLVDMFKAELVQSDLPAVRDTRLSPCPNTGDRPGVHHGRHSGKYFLMPCSLGCQVCGEIKHIAFSTELELTQRWMEVSER